ncbi:hypothetical protein [Luteococcus sp. OSA5]|uniref:hypothetical protein n=1 Tax=Luteococcus sp. OSA5 TaxID=3401630 RepID=UPI003B43B18F
MTNEMNTYAPPRTEVEPVAEAVSRPMQSLRRHWLSALIVMVLGTIAGVGLGATKPVTYTAEARVAVGTGDLSTGAIAGFPLAAKDMASNYARWVNDRGLRNGSTDGVTMAASPIPESSIIRIEGTGTDLAAVTAATKKTAEELVSSANGEGTKLDPKITFDQYTKAAAQWSKAKSDLNAAQSELEELQADDAATSRIEAARKKVTAAMAEETQQLQHMNALGAKYQKQMVDTSEAADLVLVRDAEESSNDRTSLMQRYGLLGLVAGGALALLLAVALDRRQRR